MKMMAVREKLTEAELLDLIESMYRALCPAPREELEQAIIHLPVLEPAGRAA